MNLRSDLIQWIMHILTVILLYGQLLIRITPLNRAISVPIIHPQLGFFQSCENVGHISSMKQQFVITHTIRHTMIPALPDS